MFKDGYLENPIHECKVPGSPKALNPESSVLGHIHLSTGIHFKEPEPEMIHSPSGKLSGVWINHLLVIISRWVKSFSQTVFKITN